MIDRIPTKPGRIKLTDEQGNVTYYTMERADEPLEMGTPLNKGTLLSDDTTELLGFENLESVVPDNALEMLAFLAGSALRFDGNCDWEDLPNIHIELGEYNHSNAGLTTYDLKGNFSSPPIILGQMVDISSGRVLNAYATDESHFVAVVYMLMNSPASSTGTFRYVAIGLGDPGFTINIS